MISTSDLEHNLLRHDFDFVPILESKLFCEIYIFCIKYSIMFYKTFFTLSFSEGFSRITTIYAQKVAES